MDDSMQYRSAVRPEFSGTEKVHNKDEQDYSTLQLVQSLLSDAISQLSSDFNAFSVLSGGDPDAQAKDVLVDIRARQRTHSFLATLKTAVDSAIQRTDSINAKE